MLKLRLSEVPAVSFRYFLLLAMAAAAKAAVARLRVELIKAELAAAELRRHHHHQARRPRRSGVPGSTR